MPIFKAKHNFLKFVFPSPGIEWNTLDHNIRKVRRFSVKFVRPTPNIVFNSENQGRIKHVARVLVGLSRLREHKFKHSFQDSLNPIEVAVLMLNRLLITFSTVLCIVMKEISSRPLSIVGC